MLSGRRGAQSVRARQCGRKGLRESNSKEEIPVARGGRELQPGVSRVNLHRTVKIAFALTLTVRCFLPQIERLRVFGDHMMAYSRPSLSGR